MSPKKSLFDRLIKVIAISIIVLIGGAFLVGLLYGLLIQPLMR